MSLAYYVCNHCGEIMVNDVYEECSSCERVWCSDECATKDGHNPVWCDKYEEYGAHRISKLRKEHNCKTNCESCSYYVKESCDYCRGDNFDDIVLLENALYLLGISREQLCDIVKKSNGNMENLNALYEL